MIFGRIIGKATTTQFQFQVTHLDAKKLQFIQVQHPDYGYVLSQIVELERTKDSLVATCQIIGWNDRERLQPIRTPFAIHAEVLQAEESIIEQCMALPTTGGYVGKLEGTQLPLYFDLQKALSKHIAILAKTGAGKSYTAGVIIEEIIEKGIPLLIIDPHGEYSTLKIPNYQEKETLSLWNVEPKGYAQSVTVWSEQDTHLKLQEQLTIPELLDILPITLTPTQESLLFSCAKDLTTFTFTDIIYNVEQLQSPGKWGILEAIRYLDNTKLFSTVPTPLQDIVQLHNASILSLKGVEPHLQEIIVARLLQQLFSARKQNIIPPFFCVIEEAHHFCPEKGFGKSKSTSIIRYIASEGRKFGLGLCIVSQRPALIQKTVLSQCHTQIVLKVTNPHDVKALSSSLEGITNETESQIPLLPIGSALICGIVDRPLQVRIRPRKSQYGGHAASMLAQETKPVDVEKQLDDHATLLPLILPQISKKDLELMATTPITIHTYLIPACIIVGVFGSILVRLLLDRIKGRLIINPETDTTINIAQISSKAQFNREIVYEQISFTQQLSSTISIEKIKQLLHPYITIKTIHECYIVYHKAQTNPH